MTKRKPKVSNVRIAGPEHAVCTVTSTSTAYRKEPCAECPWRVDQVGKFPAEAFRHSAGTAYDAAHNTFACHMSGVDKPATCAGFLLKNAANNVGVRVAAALGRIDLSQVQDGGIPLHDSYKAMAVANGVSPDDPVLAKCRADNQLGKPR